MLSNFQLGDQALLQSFLVGQPELRAMMQSPQMQQLRQRVIASYHLGPLDRSETQAYVEHRLCHVGWKGDPRFDAACFELIHAFGGGIPRRINLLCNRLLLAGFLAERHALGPADVQAVAHEIRDEMGPEAAVAPVPHPAPAGMPAPLAAAPVASAAAVVAPAVAAPAVAVPREPVADASLDVARWRKEFRDLETRMDRLEKLVDTAVTLLHRIQLNLEQRPTKPRPPIGR
jgi:hypothetical protein